jgi:ABC-type bacteriocin/lantibiotic exporter with double-glycine peptidase domain
MADGLLHPLLVRSIFDAIVAKHAGLHFVVLVTGYLALGLLVSGGGITVALWEKSLQVRASKSLSARLLEAYYKTEYSAVLNRGHGYYIGRIYGDVNDGLIPLLSLTVLTIKQGVLLASLSFVLIYLSWKAFVALTVLLPLSAGIGARLGSKIKSVTSQEREQEGAVLSLLTKSLAAFRIVTGFHLVAKAVQAFTGGIDDYLTIAYQRYRMARRFQAIIDLTMVISDFLSLIVGAFFVLRGTLSVGSYFAFVNAFWRALTTLLQIFKSVPDFHNLIAILARITSFLSESTPAYYRVGDSICLEDVNFAYGEYPILQALSLEVAPKERIVIVGPNGSGKTTLAHILSGYLAPSSGQVTLPETISSVTLPIAFPPVAVRDLVQDNELLAKFHLAEPAILAAAADELSAGQQQKVALLLALSQRADLYVIDEPLANLDPESKDLAMKLILERTKDKSLILIMHGSDEYHRFFDRVVTIKMMRNDRMIATTAPE